MRTLLTLALFTLVHVQTLSGQVAERALLKPPFGRQWGEAPSGLLQWAGKVELDVFVELPASEPDLQIFTFQQKGGGIPGKTGEAAHSIEARFYQDRLYELTVNFEFPVETPDEVRERFLKLKRKLEKELGKFRLNGNSQSVEDNFLTREVAFHYEPSPKVFLLLAYSSLEDRLRGKGEGRYSAIYHNGQIGPPAKGSKPAKQ